MDYFLETLPANLFKVTIGLFVLLLITGTSRRFVMAKTIRLIFGLPDEKRRNLIHVYERTISAWRILFWLAPLYLLLIPTIIYFSLPSSFLLITTLLIGAYFMLIDDFYYKRKILKAIEK